MKLLACMKKDIRLIGGSGPRGLLLAVLFTALFFLTTVFMGGITSVSTFTEPFDVAVRDEDASLTSSILINQLQKVSLFKRVIPADSRSDEEFLSEGCAAVITIPKDFFYDLYDMQDTGIGMVLNGSMPKEAAAVRSAVSAITGILEENQRLYLADAMIRGGELDEAEKEKVYAEYSSASINDLLFRLEYFSLESLYEDEALSRTVFFVAGICSMLLLFFPLSVLRSLYEEKELGITARLAAGAGIRYLLLSKLLVSLLLVAVPAAAILRLIRLPRAASLIPAFLVLFLASFTFFFVLSLLCRSPERTQLTGNMIILIMLLAGGALFPYRLLPESIRPLSLLSLPYYVNRSLYAAVLGYSAAGILETVLPALVSVPLLAAAAMLLYGRRRAL